LLNKQPQITAIAASNDLMALGVLACIRARGLRVGIDVAVAGFDDIPAAEYANPPLTTVHQPIYEIGQRLARMLIGLIQGQPPAESQLVLTPALVIRESSGSVAA
jgi:LacI family transcriptional regulator